MSIKPIETIYKGYRFRSRLEARWAVFFVAAGIKWEYEPQGFELPSGKRYLPDFLIHNVYDTRTGKTYDSLWVEVKGHMTQDDMNRIKEFADFKDVWHGDDVEGFFAQIPENPVLIVGNIPDGINIDELIKNMIYPVNDYEFNFETIDGDYFNLALMVGDEGNLVMCGSDSSYMWGYNERLTIKAYTCARQARFEHGERG